MKVLKAHKNFGGSVQFWEHDSSITKTKMHFSTYTPPGEVKGALVWLSGLTCTDENFIMKANAQRYAAQVGLMLICPDTSPRGLNLPGEHDHYAFGAGAGFYVNATTPGYRDHYKMYDYVTQEIYSILKNEFKINDNIALSGHSMGGHGALVIGLREGSKFKSVSALAPIGNPMVSSFGSKALLGYLSEDQNLWKAYDASELIKSGHRHAKTILIDQGSDDTVLDKATASQKAFQDACKEAGQSLNLRFQEGYDHSYYFVASFIEDHIQFHMKNMNLN